MIDFIGIYDNAVSEEECNKIIRWFEESGDLQEEGKCGNHEIRKDIKDSTDIAVEMAEGWLPSPIIFSALNESFSKYISEYDFLNYLDEFTLDIGYNIQRYFPNQGFYKEHCEHMGKNSIKVLAWSLYLNTVDDGGETLFTAYDKKIEAIVGRMSIWPAYWTHSHKGVTSKSRTKYIATGWFSFK